MKFIHIADMHFDSPFSLLSDRLDMGIERRLDQREAFKKMITYIKENNIDYLLIAGDLYEHEYIRQSTIEYIDGLFRQIPNTKIYISPGNHDPYLENSYYKTYKWSPNVHIFTSKIEKIEEKDFNIYGYGFDNFYTNNSGIENIKIQKEENKINILLTHANLDGSKKDIRQYNPLTSRELKEIGFDYIALGHIHKTNYQEETNMIYPGSAISLGFDELGKHGMLLVEIEKTEENTKTKKEFITLDKKEFIEKELDITNIHSEEELVEQINEIEIEENKLYKIILKGTKYFEIQLNKIIKLITNENIVKIKDFSKIDVDIEKLSKENTLKGLFAKEILEKIKNGENREKLEKILEIGLEILEK